MKTNRKSIFNTLPLFYSVILIFTAIYTFNKGLVMDDEGLYLYLLRDLKDGVFPSQFHKLFKNIFLGDIYLIRAINFSFELIAIGIFSFGLFHFLKDRFDLKLKNLLFIFCYCIIGLSIFSPKVCGVFYYVTLNREITLVSLGLLLLGLKVDGALKNLLFIASGFFIGFLFFVMITTTPIILLPLLLIYFYSSSPLKNVLLFIAGIVVSLSYYFLFIEGFQHFIQNEISPYLNNSISGDSNDMHGLSQMIRWCYMAIYFLLLNGLIGALFVFGFIYIKKNATPTQYNILLTLVIITGIFFLYNEVIKGEHHVASISPFLIMYVYFVIDQLIIRKKHTDLALLLFVLLFVSFFLSVGSYVDYKTRAADYILFIFPLIYIYASTVYSKKVNIVLIGILGVYIINSCSMLYRKNWGGFVYHDQNVALNDIGAHQNILLDRGIHDDLKIMQKGLAKNDTVIISYKNLVGYTYLLNVKVISSSIYPSEKEESEYKKCSRLSLFENVYHPFTADFINKVTADGQFKITDTIDLIPGIFRVYKLRK